MNALKLLVGAACAATIPALAAGNDASPQAQPSNEKVAVYTAPVAKQHVPRSLTDRPARKYPKAGKSEAKPEKLVHERWVHDEDHQY